MIKMNAEEIAFLDENINMDKDLRDRVMSLRLTEDDYDELRDACGEALQKYGFDQNYQLTPKGKRLEDLIDKLFTG